MALKDDPQYDYKLALRDWMKTRGLSMRWLASWLEKSETTVKNFLYGTKPISEENKEKIEALQAEYEDGEDINWRLPTGHRLINYNPDFDPVPKKCVSVDENDREISIHGKTGSLLASLHLHSLPHSSISYSSFLFSYCYKEVNEILRDAIKETISSYMQKKHIGAEEVLSCVQSAGSVYQELYGEKDAILTEEVEDLINSQSRLYIPRQIYRYACIATTIAGAPYVDVWINRVVHEWATKRQLDDFTDFLDI